MRAGTGRPKSPSLRMDALIAGGKIVGLGFCFDTFDDDAQFERLGHGENLRKNGDGDRVGADCFREGLVEQDGINREIVQISEARIAGAEVVDGDVVALLAKAENRIAGDLLARGVTLGDLDPEVARRNFSIGQSVLDHGQEIAVGKIRGGNIYIHAERGARAMGGAKVTQCT